MADPPYVLIETERAPIKAWIRGVPFEEEAARQLRNAARLPFIFKWVAAMPDVHWGLGATVGSVMPTRGAIVPAAVGVDIGCGMAAVRTSLRAEDLPDDLRDVRSAIEQAVPHGRTDRGGRNDRGSWNAPPPRSLGAWKDLARGYERIVDDHPKLGRNNPPERQMGTLGTGNHFIEVCLDEADHVWFLLHSGSRGVGNRMGNYFIELAKKDMEGFYINLPDQDLAYFPEHTEHFGDYFEAVEWAQDYARTNRRLMMDAIIAAVGSVPGI